MLSRLDPVASSWSRFPPREGADRDVAVLTYVLYALGFFTGITALVGVGLALWRRRTAFGVARTHLDWQVRVFGWGALALLCSAVLHAVVLG
ncbi:MAG: hypothetical protein INR65_20595, partial [Gluconacetobacter diazotrophicus]|nr:hypothetical protein [Gluconacetobacter diazotrophicus]